MLHVQESPYIRTFRYDNAEDFIRSISYQGELYDIFNDRFIFRGHSTDKYELLPSVLRDKFWCVDSVINDSMSGEEKKQMIHLATMELVQIQEELKLLQDFFQLCDRSGLYVPHIEFLRNSICPGFDFKTMMLEDKWLPTEYWELAALAQHHGVMTRLLDWSHDIYVALYFATTGVYNYPKEKLDIKKALHARRKGETYPMEHDIEIWALNKNVVMVKPLKVPLHIVQPGYRNNDNLRAQKGVFTFWETIYPGMIGEGSKVKIDVTPTDRRTLDVQLDKYLKEIKSPEKPYLYQILIPQDAAQAIYSHIDKLGYNAATIFPGYDGVARCMKERKTILAKQNNKE